MNKESLILIIGAGSIGERHIRNLWQFGYRNMIVFRQRNLPFREIGEAQVTVSLNWDEVINKKPFAAFICTPTSQHLEQVKNCLQNNMHVFVEKPLSHNLENIEELKSIASNSIKLLQIGFMMRFHPLILKVKNYIEDKTFGNLISTVSHWGSYLPDWHPWENYKESYAANKSLGGGVALTLCHDIDVAIWLSGSAVKKFETIKSHSNELDINAESVADIKINFESGVISNIHLNYLDNPPIRKYTWQFENANLELNYFANRLSINPEQNIGAVQEIKLESFDRNQMFLAEINSFFNNIEIKNNNTQYSLNQIIESELLISICNYAD